MYTLIGQNGHESYNIKHFVCDTQADIQDLPLDVKAGSDAICLDPVSVYMLSTAGEWKVL